LAIDTQMTVTPQVRKLETSANYGKFDIEPLEPGFGTTLGNTLRRVLLSSLWGAAVTSIQIDGVAHEFTAIPHVKEDVTEVILNLKRLCLKSFTEDPVTLLLDVKGPAEVRASHIQASSDVEIVNPDLYICTLAAKGHLRMELNVERGKGYVPADRNKREGQPIGVIPIDAIFSPVEKANFTVEKTRVGQSTDYDRLLIEVWTDGTMSPEEAVSHAASLFTKHLQLFVNFPVSITRPGTPEKSEQSRLMDTPIEELDLSVRAFNCLKANEIQTVGQLLQKREEELLALRNFGRKSLDEIKEKLVEKGFIKPEEMGSVLRG
jgi:DNA-directed RNA polymerase subunit alpha